MSLAKINTIENVAGTKQFTVDEVRAMLDKQAILDSRTWQDVSASRLSGTVYTNNTGADIELSISAGMAGANQRPNIIIAGTEIIGSNAGDNGASVTINVTVPNGATYVHGANSGTIDNIRVWNELRP